MIGQRHIGFAAFINGTTSVEMVNRWLWLVYIDRVSFSGGKFNWNRPEGVDLGDFSFAWNPTIPSSPGAPHDPFTPPNNQHSLNTIDFISGNVNRNHLVTAIGQSNCAKIKRTPKKLSVQKVHLIRLSCRQFSHFFHPLLICSCREYRQNILSE